jgi:hypothetical protein
MWYTEYITAAYETGLIDAAEYFYPEEPATREFVAKMLSNVISTEGGELALSFADSGEISNDCTEAIKQLASHQIINGYPDNTFRPHNIVTRSEYAVMLGRIIDRGLMNHNTPLEAYAEERTRWFFEIYPTFEERFQIYYGYEGGINYIFDNH